ncbi:acylphosphatase [Akanthomyces lecanii RCEF 1005]|uniref:acylphosphatase n=1 Tax=Akanthomyces lecanii RCEF 1005 TaxID=1081108 RepID=A0A168L1C6_CORDF|nr:acylphosphatase [Akanthomyces lecanii RCEF 1005]
MTRRVYFAAHGGTVQGVGFRYFTRKRAQTYGLTGWCRNTPDNKVEGEVQGEDAAVDKLLKDIDQGPSGATVVKLTQEARDVVADEAEFAVRH